MSEDFVTQLRLQLREAAEREARGGPARRLARRARSRQLWRPALAFAALVLAVLAAISAASSLRDRQTTPATHGLRVLLRQPLVNEGAGIWPAFGSVWAEDGSTGELLRIDPRTHRVIARIKVSSGEFGFDFVDGAVWALDAQRLVKIDPAINRVVASIPVRARGIVAGRDALWIGTPLGIRRVDPETHALGRSIDLTREGFQANGVASDGRRLYFSRADGTLLVFDAHTGARLPSPGVEVEGNAAAAANGTVILVSFRHLSALDVRTARTRWNVDIGAKGINNVALGGGSLWVEGVDGRTANDRLWRLDPATGRVTASLLLSDFGAPGLAAVDGHAWLVASNGTLQIIG